MRPALAAVPLLLCAAGIAQAQSQTKLPPIQSPAQDNPFPAQPPGSSMTFVPSQVLLLPSACPVAMSARPQASVMTHWVAANEDGNFHPARERAGIHVDLTALERISQVELLVSYEKYPVGIVPINAGNSGRPILRKTYTLSSDEAVRQLSGDLLLGREFYVRHVHLASLTYADGSVLRFEDPERCTVTPSHFIQVNAR
jgi:hypothetical protein